MNTKHNHSKTYMSRKKREEDINASFEAFPIINVQNEDVEEIDAEDIDLDYLVEEAEEEDMEMGGNNVVEYIRVTCDDELNYEEIDNLDTSAEDSEETAASTESNLRTDLQSTQTNLIKQAIRTFFKFVIASILTTYCAKNLLKMTCFNYSGVLAPVFTPFKNDGKMALNMDIVPKYIKFLHDRGIRGVLVNGTSGEGTSMSVYERKIVAEKWITCARDYNMHVMIQVGGAPLPDVLELASHAEKFGANSILCLPELYMKPTTNLHLINYLKLISEAAPKTPLLYYHIPMFSNVTLHMGKFLNEIRNEVPTFSGIKFTSNALDEGIDAAKANGGSFEIFLGNDKLMLGAYALGLKSSIATTLNIFPRLGIKILEHVNNNEFTNAKETQENLSAIVDTITKYGDWVSTMKEAMNILTPINCGPVRKTLPGIAEKDANEMSSLLQKYKYLL